MIKLPENFELDRYGLHVRFVRAEGEILILGFKEFWFAGRTRAEHLLLRISTGYCSVLLNRFTYLSRMSLEYEF